ncbi:nuclease [Methylobacterium sp. A54F]
MFKARDAKADQQEGSGGTPEAAPRPVSPERQRLRALIQAEIAGRRPRPVALRTLGLIAEAALEPTEAEPGYRVVDRDGAPRHRPASAGDTPAGASTTQPITSPLPSPLPSPMTLAELLDEIAARHPALFLPPEPEPAPAAPEPPAPSAADEMRAATARFVETQSALARNLAERSGAHGRALAASAAGTMSALRDRFDARMRAREAARAEPHAEPHAESRAEAQLVPDPPAVEAAAPAPRAAPAPQAAPPAWHGHVGLAARMRDAGDRVRERVREGFGAGGDPERRHRRWLGGGIVAAGLAVVAASLVVASRTPPEERAVQERTAVERTAGERTTDARPRPSAQAEAPAAPAASDGRAEAEAPAETAPPPAANEVRGVPDVIDTATLRVGGKLIHLFGVEWVRGGQAEELAKYLAGRSVSCQPASGSENYACQVEGRDLSEVVLFNGGGRASSEASPDLVAAEDHARSERLGVWKR